MLNTKCNSFNISITLTVERRSQLRGTWALRPAKEGRPSETAGRADPLREGRPSETAGRADRAV